MCIFFCQATPRLSEDKVKQCVDPRMKGEYPPKGVAKVSLLPDTLFLSTFMLTILMNSCASVNLMPCILICSLLQWQLYACNTKQSSGPTWVLLWRRSLLSSIKDLHPLLQSQHWRHLWVEVLYVMWCIGIHRLTIWQSAYSICVAESILDASFWGFNWRAYIPLCLKFVLRCWLKLVCFLLCPARFTVWSEFVICSMMGLVIYSLCWCVGLF
jgi:hypothetical protein